MSLYVSRRAALYSPTFHHGVSVICSMPHGDLMKAMVCISSSSLPRCLWSRTHHGMHNSVCHKTPGTGPQMVHCPSQWHRLDQMEWTRLDLCVGIGSGMQTIPSWGYINTFLYPWHLSIPIQSLYEGRIGGAADVFGRVPIKWLMKITIQIMGTRCSEKNAKDVLFCFSFCSSH